MKQVTASIPLETLPCAGLFSGKGLPARAPTTFVKVPRARRVWVDPSEAMI